MGAAGFRPLLAAVTLLGTACASIAADARTFEGTRWHVTAINGHETPTARNFEMSFVDGQVGGQFGCNRFGGPIRVTGDVMTTTGIATTEMACDWVGDQPRASPMDYESWGLAVLARPMRMNWKSALKLTLTNDAGSIELELLP